MKQDTIFYQLFVRSPALLFELLPDPPPNAGQYRFEAIEVKQVGYRMDGVFLPPAPTSDIFFCEVQQKIDEFLYERMMAEISIYAHHKRNTFKNWQAVVIYPRRKIEQKCCDLVAEFLESGRITRVYLDELGDIAALPWGLGLMVLTMRPKKKVVEEAKAMLSRSETASVKSAILELVSTIMIHKFNTLSRAEVNKMLGIQLQETRVYQEAQEEQAVSTVLRLLARKLGSLDDAVVKQINCLNLKQLNSLTDGIFDFNDITDLQSYLNSLSWYDQFRLCGSLLLKRSVMVKEPLRLHHG